MVTDGVVFKHQGISNNIDSVTLTNSHPGVSSSQWVNLVVQC